MPYTVVNDAMPTGATASGAVAINASGEIAGIGALSWGGPDDMGATWSTIGAATILPGFSSDDWPVTAVNGINSSGDVIGYRLDTVNSYTVYYDAVLWTPGSSTPTILNDAGGQNQSAAWAINGYGDSSGLSETGFGAEAVYWNAAGASTPLASLGTSNVGSGHADDQGMAINNLGEIGGQSTGRRLLWSDTGSIIWHSSHVDSGISAINAASASVGFDDGNPAYWSPRGRETLLAEPGGSAQDRVSAINASGHSVGYSGTDAVEWSRTGAATVLADLPGTTGAEAMAINKTGASVGYCYGSFGYAATHWSATGKVLDLQTILGPGWTTTQATGINDAGDICGYGVDNGVHSAWELLCVSKAGSTDNGSYVNAASHDVLTASAVHAPVTESAAHGFASVGHGPG